MSSCVIYYAGDQYGPSILCQLKDCIDPLVRKVSTDGVDVYFLAGTHTHIRQRWRLLGYTAKLEKEEEISWRDDPRMKVHAEPTVQRQPLGFREPVGETDVRDFTAVAHTERWGP